MKTKCIACKLQNVQIEALKHPSSQSVANLTLVGKKIPSFLLHPSFKQENITSEQRLEVDEFVRSLCDAHVFRLSKKEETGFFDLCKQYIETLTSLEKLCARKGL